MHSLRNRHMVVIGGSRGVGRRIVEAGIRSGARVLAVARQEGPLRQLAQDIDGTEILSLDAAEEDAPSKVFNVLEPHILVLCGGVFPPAAPLHEQSWQEFAVNWESDVKIAFHFCKAALSRPLPAGVSVILISSGAALAGSPNSGAMPEPNERRYSWQTTPKRNRIAWDSGCDSWHWRRASCRTPSLVSMQSPATPAILACPRPNSARAWLRRRILLMSPRRLLSWLTIRIIARARRSLSSVRVWKSCPRHDGVWQLRLKTIRKIGFALKPSREAAIWYNATR
jgi:NAD(P)-dependent dehydrogenase (short-subunit alcohol dehydrogenase family)